MLTNRRVMFLVSVLMQLCVKRDALKGTAEYSVDRNGGKSTDCKESCRKVKGTAISKGIRRKGESAESMEKRVGGK